MEKKSSARRAIRGARVVVNHGTPRPCGHLKAAGADVSAYRSMEVITQLK